MLSQFLACRWHRPICPPGKVPVLIFSLLAGIPIAETRAAETPIVDPGRVWALGADEKRSAHPIRFEGRVSYTEKRWRHLWLDTGDRGVAEYIPLSTTPPELRQGQRVRIEGTLVPQKGLEADRVRVTVLEESTPAHPVDATGNIHDRDAFWCRIVTVRAYVDGVMLNDPDHLKLSLIVGDQPVIGWLRPADPQHLPDWRGRVVQFTGLYQARFDPTATQLTLELWTADARDVVVLDRAPELARFDRAVTPINEIPRLRAAGEVKIRGRVRASQPGSVVTVRDATGQILAHSPQQERLPFGTEIELVGRPVLTGGRWTLRSGFYRVVGPPPVGDDPNLGTVEQIRQLNLDQAARGLPVRITGVVTWSAPGQESFYFADLTGGIRVRFDPAQFEPPARNKYLHLEGETIDGGFAPAVRLRRMEDLGAMETPPVREISYDKAITGEEDGQLVEMRGFFQRTEADGPQQKIHLVTPRGEVVGLLNAAVPFSPAVGSLVRARGACEVVVDAGGRASGVVLHLGSLSSLVIEADAPADVFDLPPRTLKSLRALGESGDLVRVRVGGVVLHAVPGRSIYLQQDGVAMQLLTREHEVLLPGDEIDAVGILVREGMRTELRDTVARRLRGGPPPAPLELNNPARLSSALDSRLVRVRGGLIDSDTTGGRTRLTLQAGGELFEAVLEAPAASLPTDAVRTGVGLELTGLYRLRYDDSRHSRSFQLLLRSPEDVAIYRKPRLWTLSRALAAVGILSGCVLLGLAWVVALRRRMRAQTAQIRAQLERQARLEAELHRTARLESLGDLAGGIAHDFNNVLTVILGHLGLALADAKLAAEPASHLQEIARAAGRARRLTRQLLTFATGGDPTLGAVDWPALVREAFDQVLEGTTVRGEIHAEDNLPDVSADRDQLLQAIQNLTLNAVQAMPRGGTLTATLGGVTIEGGGHPLAAGRYVKLSLTDTGEGIPPEALPRIFDPYFSTRETGSGLGLATVYSIVAKHQGRVEVESTVGQGTTFHLWFPVAVPRSRGSDAPFPAAPLQTEPAAAQGRTRRILFMDDEESIRLIGSIALKRGGYDVVAVADGAAAVQAFGEARAEGRPFDLLILDLTIPGAMGGRETIEQIRQMDTAVPAIVSSGYSSDPVMANFEAYGFQATVPKPYEIGVLMAAIERTLAARR